MHHPLLNEFFTAGTFLLFLFLSISVKVPNVVFSFQFLFSFIFAFFPFIAQSPQLPSTGFSSLLMSGESKCWSNAVGSSLLPISSDLGHSTKPRVPGTGGVILYQAWNWESHLQGWMKFLEISGPEQSFTLPNCRLCNKILLSWVSILKFEYRILSLLSFTIECAIKYSNFISVIAFQGEERGMFLNKHFKKLFGIEESQ